MPHVPTYKIQPLAGENIAPVPIEDAIKEELQVSKANSYIWNVFYDFLWSKLQHLGVEQCGGCGGPEKTPGSTFNSQVFNISIPFKITKDVFVDQLLPYRTVADPTGEPDEELAQVVMASLEDFLAESLIFSGEGLAEADWEQSNQRKGGFGAGLSQGSPQ